MSAIPNISHEIQRQFPLNLELLGIPRNSQKFPLLFSPIPKYSQKFQGFLSLLICMPWNKLEFLGIPRNSQNSGNSLCKGCMSFKIALIWCRQVQLGLVGWGLGFGHQKLYKEMGKLAFHGAM